MTTNKVKIIGLIALDIEMGIVIDDGVLSVTWDAFLPLKEESAYAAVIMSERTYLNKPTVIPDRLNIVISNNLPLDTPGVLVVRNLNEAYCTGYERSKANGTSIYVVLDKTLYDQCKAHLSEISICQLNINTKSLYSVPELPQRTECIADGMYYGPYMYTRYTLCT